MIIKRRVPDAGSLAGAIKSMVLLCMLFAPLAGGSTLPVPDRPYTQVTPSRDGIGKVYLGREISQVMGHRGAGWLERGTREREERTDLLLSLLAGEWAYRRGRRLA